MFSLSGGWEGRGIFVFAVGGGAKQPPINHVTTCPVRLQNLCPAKPRPSIQAPQTPKAAQAPLELRLTPAAPTVAPPTKRPSNRPTKPHGHARRAAHGGHMRGATRARAHPRRASVKSRHNGQRYMWRFCDRSVQHRLHMPLCSHATGQGKTPRECKPTGGPRRVRGANLENRIADGNKALAGGPREVRNARPPGPTKPTA